MLITEWNIEEAKEVWFEEGWREGFEESLRKSGRKDCEEIIRNVSALFDKGLSVKDVKRCLDGPIDRARM
jgi:hypothetical protein